MLMYAQREAELAKKCLQAQEAHRKTHALQQHTQTTSGKKSHKSRYDACSSINAYTRQQEKLPAGPYDNTEESKDLDTKLVIIKDNIKKLNPLRRARQTHAHHSGANNPNIPGQDNGLNAWMDVALNPKAVDSTLRYEASYAKKNSDNNRFNDIDDIPI